MQEEFYSQWQLGLVDNQRLGQAAYNAAHRVYGGVVEDVNGTLFDPFNDDSAIPLFLRWLSLNTAKLPWGRCDDAGCNSPVYPNFDSVFCPDHYDD